MKSAKAKKFRLEAKVEAVKVEKAPEITQMAQEPKATNLEMPMLYSAEANLF